jgi:predicted transcriptional regulator
MNFDDALRKVIEESEEGQYEISERASFNYFDLSKFLKWKRKLHLSEMQQLYDALKESDREKWRSLIASNK